MAAKLKTHLPRLVLTLLLSSGLLLALLFLRLFIWLIGGVIPALIRGVFALGRKWCYKEVPVT